MLYNSLRYRKKPQISRGMFAFALWDINEKILHLARDRIGEKPIYYGWQNNCFIFASELKAIKKFPNFDKELSKQAIDMQLKLSYVQLHTPFIKIFLN